MQLHAAATSVHRVSATKRIRDEMHVGVAFEDSADEIHRQMIVQEPEAGPCGQLDTNGVFADARRAVQEDQFHLD